MLYGYIWPTYFCQKTCVPFHPKKIGQERVKNHYSKIIQLHGNEGKRRINEKEEISRISSSASIL